MKYVSVYCQVGINSTDFQCDGCWGWTVAMVTYWRDQGLQVSLCCSTQPLAHLLVMSLIAVKNINDGFLLYVFVQYLPCFLPSHSQNCKVNPYGCSFMVDLLTIIQS